MELTDKQLVTLIRKHETQTGKCSREWTIDDIIVFARRKNKIAERLSRRADRRPPCALTVPC